MCQIQGYTLHLAVLEHRPLQLSPPGDILPSGRLNLTREGLGASGASLSTGNHCQVAPVFQHSNWGEAPKFGNI